jgi:hypothetical protein
LRCTTGAAHSLTFAGNYAFATRGFGWVQAGQHEEASMTTSSRKFFAVIIERNGQELARDVLHTDGVADARRRLMQLVRQHEIDPFDEPINCRVEELSE